MSRLQRVVERLVRRLKADPSYRIAGGYTDRQLLAILWQRGIQRMRGLSLLLRRRVEQPVFRGRRVVIEHGYALSSGSSLILEDGVAINALSTNGVALGRNVTIARGATLVCTGVIAELGTGIRIGDRSAVGAGAFLGGQGGIDIGADVIMGPGVRIFSENHRFDDVSRTIRSQGTERARVSIGDDCWVGAGATIVAGVTIGSGCVIAAGAVVTSSAPALSVLAGVPARVVRSRRPAEVLQAGRPLAAQLPVPGHVPVTSPRDSARSADQ